MTQYLPMADGTPPPPPLNDFPTDKHRALLLAVDEAEEQYERDPSEETLAVFNAAVEALDEFYDQHPVPEDDS